MSISHYEVARSWFIDGKHKAGSSLYAKDDMLFCRYSFPMTQRISDGFVLINTDVLSRSHSYNLYYPIVCALKDRGVPISFTALEKSGVPKNRLCIVYRDPVESLYCAFKRTILGISGTERVLAAVRDRYWIGLIEPIGFFRDPELVLASLVPRDITGNEVLLYAKDDRCAIRHGEFYLVPRPNFKRPRELQVKKWQYLKSSVDGSNFNHRTRDLVIVDGKTYIRGTVRHTRRRLLSLRFRPNNGKIEEPWYEVLTASQAGSWKGEHFWG